MRLRFRSSSSELNRRKASATAASLVLLALAPRAAMAFDLSTAVREALQYDAIFQAAKKKAEADATRAGQGLGQLLPSASTSASRARTDYDLANRSDFSYSGRYANTYSISLTQPIFRLDKMAVFNQERQRSIVGEVNFAQARIDSLLRVTQAYFDVLVAQDSLASTESNLKAINEQLESAKRNFEVGTATITDQQEAQARFDLATAQQIVAKNDLNIKRNALNQLVGKPMPARFPGLGEQVSIKAPEPLDVDRWVEQARGANLKVQAAIGAAEIAKSEVTRVVAVDNLPSIDLVASKKRIQPVIISGTAYNNSETDSIALELTLPLFNGGAPTSRAKEAVALREKSDFDLENERRNAEQSARTAFLNVLTGLSQVKAYEAAEKSSRLALESNLLGYEVGVRINIDVLNAQQQLFTTQRDLSKARYDTLINSLKLKSTTGSLSEADIDEISRLLAK